MSDKRFKPAREQEQASIRICSDRRDFVTPKSLIGALAGAKTSPYSFERLPVDSNWDDMKMRVLVVSEMVDSRDLKAGTFLCQDGRQTKLLHEVLRKAAATAGSLTGKSIKRGEDWALACVNFNHGKTFHLPYGTKLGFDALFAKRVEGIIKKLAPTHVLICGDVAATYLLEGKVEDTGFKRGWVHKVTLGGHQVKCTTTIDADRLYSIKKNKDTDEDEEEDEGSKDVYGVANLVGFFLRNATNLFAGKHLHSLRHILPNPIYVDTIEKFDSLYAKLKACKRVAIDTETKNLTVTNNRIYTIQFAFREDKGYLLPVDHPQTPFSKEDRKYIKKRLKKWFSAAPEDHFEEMIMQNGAFDLRVIRATLGIPIIYREVWDTQAGEVCLDENIKFIGGGEKGKFQRYPNGAPSARTIQERAEFNKMGQTGLMAIFAYYDNDKYLTLPFSKGQRNNIGAVDCADKDFQDYSVLDVQSLIGIRKMQLLRAEQMRDEGHESGNYKARYMDYMRYQMSSTVHTISHMTQMGVYIDMLYLAFLMSKASPLVMEANRIRSDLVKLPEVIEANSILLKESGRSSNKGGLFGRVDWVFNENKFEHKKVLFMDVMGLEPLTVSIKTKRPQFDKFFYAHYQKEHKVVEMFAQLSIIDKLLSTYVRGWWNQLKTNGEKGTPRLRPGYGFIAVLTGRLNSYKPSLQNVPTRSALAKHIKRMFAAPYGCLYVKYDYSAHEVRGWSIVSDDKVLASVFRVGQKLRQQYRFKPSQELKDKIKKEGDIHIINVKFFLGQDVTKDHPLRDGIKAIVFGKIYGKSARTLGKDIEKNDTKLAKSAIEKAQASSKEYLEEIKKRGLKVPA